MLKIKKNKFALIGLVVSILSVGIIFASVNNTRMNMITFSTLEKEKLFLENTLSSEINHYTSLKYSEIESKTYFVDYENTKVKVENKILIKVDNYIELQLTVSCDELENSKVIKLMY